MKQALIIVDIQNDYFPGGRMALTGMEAAAENARRVLDVFRANGLPIFHVQHISNRPGATFFLPETDGVEIHQTVAPTPGENIVRKHFPNSFKDTPLQKLLLESGVEEVVICGAMTHMCIDTTVRSAFDLGFRCIVVSDACATKNLQFGGLVVEAPHVQAAFMAALSNPFARIATVEELQDYLG